MPRDSNLSARMGKISRPRTDTTSEPATPFRKPPAAYPRKTTVDFSDEDHRALRIATAEDRIPIAERIRALVRLWQEDDRVRESVTRIVTESRGIPGQQAGADANTREERRDDGKQNPRSPGR